MRVRPVQSNQPTSSPNLSSLGFDEIGKGTAVIDGKAVPVTVALSVDIADTKAWQKDPNHPAKLTGELTVDGKAVPVQGELQLMKRHGGFHHLVYRFESPAQSGQPAYRFAGAKKLEDDPGFDMLSDLREVTGNFVGPDVELDGIAERAKGETTLLFPGSFLKYFGSYRGDDAAAYGRFAKVFVGPIVQEYFAGKLSGDGDAPRVSNSLQLRAIKDKPTKQQLRALAEMYGDLMHGNRNGVPDKGLDGYISKLSKRDKSKAGRAVMKVLASSARISPEALDRIPKGQRDFYRATKALQANAANRPASEITERVVTAENIGVTDPVTNETTHVNHSLFCQEWAAKDPNGDVLVITPAYQATGRWWSHVADDASDNGVQTLAMDPQYAGYSAGEAGRFDGESLAASVALMLTEAKKSQQAHGATGTVRLVGESLGAAAVFCGAVLAYNGKVDLPKDALPEGEVFVAMVNPYLGKLTNRVGEIAGELLKGLPFSLPTREFVTDVVKDEDAEKRFDHLVALEDIKVHPSGLVSSRDMIQHVMEGLESGELTLPPNLKFGMLRTKDDASVIVSETDRLEKILGPNLVVKRTVEGRDHSIVLHHELRNDVAALARAQLPG